MSQYERIIKAVRETPWAIKPRVLAQIRELLALRASGERLSEAEVAERIGAGPARRQMQRVGAVAVLPLYGVIMPKATLMTEMSGGTSVQQFRQGLREALGARDVASILLDIDSPGGMVDQVPELAAEIRQARKDKPIVAVANTDAASAAYWIGAQADRLIVTPSGAVGSIGVFAAHDDLSSAQEKVGIKTTLISAGKFKTEGNPFEPLTDEARAAMQETVDEFYGMFVSDVAKGRGVSVEKVRSGFGEGRMVTAKNAVKEGMADGIGTLDQVLANLAGQARSRPRSVEEARVALENGDRVSYAEWCAINGIEPNHTSNVNVTGTTTTDSAVAAAFAAVLEEAEPEPLTLTDVETKDSGAGKGVFTVSARIGGYVADPEATAVLILDEDEVATTHAEPSAFELVADGDGTRLWARISDDKLRARFEEPLTVTIEGTDELRVVLTGAEADGRSPQGGADEPSQQGGEPDEFADRRAALAAKAAQMKVDLTSLTRRVDQL